MSEGERPLEPIGDLSEQYFFFYLSIHNNDIVGYLKQVTFYYTHLSGVVTGEAFLFLAGKRNGSNTLLCNNKIFYMGSYTKYIDSFFNKQNNIIIYIEHYVFR